MPATTKKSREALFDGRRIAAATVYEPMKPATSPSRLLTLMFERLQLPNRNVNDSPSAAWFLRTAGAGPVCSQPTGSGPPGNSRRSDEARTRQGVRPNVVRTVYFVRGARPANSITRV